MGSRKKPVSVALIGNDGAGKTTLAGMIVSEFSSRGIDAVCYQIARRALIDRVLNLMPKSGIKNFREGFEERTSEERGFIMRMWPYVEYVDAKFTFWTRSLRRRADLVVYDRYVYDLVAKYERLGYDKARIERLFFGIERPTLVFFLDARPEVLFERTRLTHQLGMRFFELSSTIYRDLARRIRAHWLNAEAPLAELLQEVTTAIESEMNP